MLLVFHYLHILRRQLYTCDFITCSCKKMNARASVSLYI